VLPKISLPTKEVHLSDGSSVTVRGLSRSEALEFVGNDFDERDIEIKLLAKVCEVPEKEAEEWINSTPSADVGTMVEGILELSGLTEQSKKE
jgi:hypothetical protein